MRKTSPMSTPPRDITANLAFTPAERDQFCNDYARLSLGLQVGSDYLLLS